MNFPKTLIIGLGGLGSDIVVNTYKRFTAHAKHKEDRDKVRFLAFDTDSNEIYKRRSIMPESDVIQTSSTSNVVAGRYIDEIKDISDVENWFPVNTKELNLMSINDGAGQVRVVSRLALAHAIHSGKINRLRQVIDELLDLKTGEGNNIEVHIVSTLAGGTGAGSFLQMAYLVREYLLRGGIQNPKILGYFMLGDILLHDPTINLSDPTKTTNVLANSYASIKELNGIFGIKDGKEIPFEYGEFGTKFKINSYNSEPYMQIFLYDFENNAGNNLKFTKNYSKQIEDFLYLNAFSPTGPATRSQAINSIIETIKRGTTAKYASTGISKVVYPVDNLLKYFSAKRLRDNLQTTWLKIDNDFDKLYKEYIKDINKGLIKKEPELSEFFIRNVESLANNGVGVEQAIFKYVLNSTKIFDKDTQKFIVNKTDLFYNNMNEYLQKLRDSDAQINIYSNLPINDTFTDNTNDEENDMAYIKEVEDQLKALYDEVFSFLEDNKKLALEEIYIKDYESPQFYSEQAKHRINTYILEKGKAMHPLAQRYFFYQLLRKLEDEFSVIKDENKNILGKINSYEKIYDLKSEDGGDDELIETALDAYRIFTEKNKGIVNKVKGIFGNANSLKEFKEDYISKSKKQSLNLKKYASSKLQEHVIEGLIFQVKKTIDNLELLFKTIPDVMQGLKDTYHGLVEEIKYGDSSHIYVLAEEKYRDYIYENVISLMDTIIFPEDMSREIYKELFNRTYNQLINPTFYSIDKTDNRIKTIFERNVVNNQVKQYRDKFKDDFAGYNVIKAIRKQAELDGVKFEDLLNEIMREAERRATPYGAKYDGKATKINSWALHPECVEINNLNDKLQDIAFSNVGAAQNNANLVVSDYFDKTVIIREDTVMILSVPENYPKFAAKDTSQKYSQSHHGIYYQYYKKRINETKYNPSLPQPHLDKRWVNPDFFKDLGVSGDYYKRKVIRAYIWGLANGYLGVHNHFGSKIWVYHNSINTIGIEFIKDINGKNLKATINNLLLEGLWNNVKIVDEITQQLDKGIEDANNTWMSIRMKPRINIKSIKMIKNFVNYKFIDFPDFNDKNLITIFNGYLTNNDAEFVGYVIDDFLDTIIKITGDKEENTKGIAGNLIFKMIEGVKNDVIITKENIKNMIDNKFN